MPDISQIDSGTTLGQVVIGLIALAMIVTTFKDVFKGVPKAVKHRNYRNLASELKETRLELNFQRGMNKSMREWELLAREVIRQMQNDLVEAGVEMDPRVTRLMELLEDNEKVRGEFIEEELSREPESERNLEK